VFAPPAHRRNAATLRTHASARGDRRGARFAPGRGPSEDGGATREARRYRGASSPAKQDPWVGRSAKRASRRAGPRAASAFSTSLRPAFSTSPLRSLARRARREPPVATSVFAPPRIAGMRRPCTRSPARGVTVAEPASRQAGDPRRTVARPGRPAATAAPAPLRSRIRGSAAARNGLRDGQDPEPRPRSRRATAPRSRRASAPRSRRAPARYRRRTSVTTAVTASRTASATTTRTAAVTVCALPTGNSWKNATR
jgi:hypothetical protein